VRPTKGDLMPELKHSYIDNEIARAVLLLQDHDVDSKEYEVILRRIETMHKLREEDKPKHPSPDTVLTVTANLIGIFMIIRHEELNVLTSKALSFIRLR
jgi:hypothetical protein